MSPSLEFDRRYPLATLVKANPSTYIEKSRRHEVGIVVDNKIDIDLSTNLKREKVLILWSDGSTEWVPLFKLHRVDRQT